MSKITIYLEGMKLERIDRYCKEKKISRSKLFARGALSIVNAEPIKKCEFCPRPSLGDFEILTQDWERGEVKVVKSLCGFHLNKARSEGEVKAL